MVDTNVHWTGQSDEAFQYAVSSQFVDQVEVRLEELKMNYAELAKVLDITKSAVSQFMRDPQNLRLSTMTKMARVLGMKFTIVAYNDADASSGPVEPTFVRKCWEHFGSPQNGWDLDKALGTKTVEENDNS